MLLAWLNLFWILFLLSADENNLIQFQLVLPTNFAAYRPNLLALDFSPNDPIGSRSTGGHLEISSINNQRTARVFIRLLAYLREANISSTSLPSIFWKYSTTFHQLTKIFKDFFACKFVLAANHQQPEIIQRLFRLQICLSRKLSTIFRKYSKTFWAAAINSKQPTAAINSSNQQKQPTAAINSSNQQQQLTTATSIRNQQQQFATTTSSHTTSSIHTIHDDFL